MESLWLLLSAPLAIGAIAACGDAVAQKDAETLAPDVSGVADVVADIEPDLAVEVEMDSADTVADTTAPPPATQVETGSATPLGLDALSANGRVHARGRPASYWYELTLTAE